MLKIKKWGIILISISTVLYSCSKKEVTPKSSNNNNNNTTNNYRDVFIGKWNFNGKRLSYSDTYNKSIPIVNYIGSISKSTLNDKGIIIKYMDGYENEFDIDSIGVIRSYGVKLGQIINNKTLNLSWQTESDGGMSGNSTVTTVNLTATKN